MSFPSVFLGAVEAEEAEAFISAFINIPLVCEPDESLESLFLASDRWEDFPFVSPALVSGDSLRRRAASSPLLERRSPAWQRRASSLAIWGLWLRVTKPYGVVTLVRCGRDRAALLAGSRP